MAVEGCPVQLFIFVSIAGQHPIQIQLKFFDRFKFQKIMCVFLLAIDTRAQLTYGVHELIVLGQF